MELREVNIDDYEELFDDSIKDTVDMEDGTYLVYECGTWRLYEWMGNGWYYHGLDIMKFADVEPSKILGPLPRRLSE